MHLSSTAVLQDSTTMLQLEARVASVQIVTGFPAHMIIPEPPGWRPACKIDTGISLGVTGWETRTPSATSGERGGTPYAERSAVNKKASSSFGPADKRS